MTQAFARPAASSRAPAAEVAIPEQYLEELQRMNQWLSGEDESKCSSWEVTMEGPSDKEQRAKLHDVIKKRFPFLMTSTQRVEEVFVITIKPDLTFAELKSMLSMDDLTLLYEFRNTSVDPDGQAIIGRG